MIDHSASCGYDADDDGANAHFDLGCPGCVAHLTHNGNLEIEQDRQS